MDIEEVEMLFSVPRKPFVVALSALVLTTACNTSTLDFDMRGKMGSRFDTSEAARNATANRPRPDERGIISYPSYQVAVARRGDTLGRLATRIGINPADLARFNGMQPDDPLRAGEIVALPYKVAEPAGGPIRPEGEVDITEIAGAAIDNAAATPVETSELPPVQTGAEPVRHKVERGETAYTIARLYGVSVRALADWNGLDREFTVREGQYLLIPTVRQSAAIDEANTSEPGAGSPTPTPPSAAQPLPTETPQPAATPVATPPSPDLGKEQKPKPASSARMQMPLTGTIIREYSKGRNDGIDISASAGTAVKAAAAGTVAAITADADQVPIIVIKHPDNVLTVYANVDAISVKKGQSVSRGQTIAKLRAGDASYLHFEVREGFESVDPMPYLR
ncbi:LysM peptidoglycan-binding domain-containing M23 family metallopeptidase [Primorskyibacter aestuariivivens]|uniref:LysM peptidoglycan-binding domain-containing M23 family metallopeptidase n=1 Tax=Primorskyibacter aestuariivivens TaxID=1888912 RepID=UPI0023005A9F|nr:LysM peptidoglycan-binding domain-containing M23 family metallopeptidase [Primorskyibacter aestuariivivens]MDA7428782.1 LysM peptidoglycan-binding domain-containing M23 family metallopeptidase [Primorskyibacter aestuariivivens]